MRKLNVEILKQNITSRAEKQLNENRFDGGSEASTARDFETDVMNSFNK